ncbi:MAG: response regulator, partial [Bacteroidota bacterium]|nr:response regulator [Bacteroidota bacterium]
MINAIIIEDEKPAMEALVNLLSEISIEVNIKARLDNIKSSIEYLSNHPGADIIFSDVQLSDGLSFEIFTQTGIQIPVIFITGYDKYMMMAFENNGIDYLLKPVNKTDLEKALLKYKKLQTHFSQTNTNEPIENLVKFINGRKKTRLLVKRGMENIALKLEEITLFYTENKVVYVLDCFSKKYICDKTL